MFSIGAGYEKLKSSVCGSGAIMSRALGVFLPYFSASLFRYLDAKKCEP